MDVERGWRIVRNVAAGFVVVGSLALAVLLFIIGTVFTAPVFGGTPDLRAVLVAASLCCVVACLLVSIGAFEQGRRWTLQGRRWTFLLAAAALVLAAALVVRSGLALPVMDPLIFALLALVTPWWAPQ